MSEKPGPRPRQGMSFPVKAIVWTIISFVVGAIGGYISVFLSAPFYFGFFLAWVLTGMVGMFVLAVHVAESSRRPR
jgi:zinc transporter ZupT